MGACNLTSRLERMENKSKSGNFQVIGFSKESGFFKVDRNGNEIQITEKEFDTIQKEAEKKNLLLFIEDVNE